MYNRLDRIPECDGRTDRRTDRQTSCHGIVRAMHTRRAVKKSDNKCIEDDTKAAARLNPNCITTTTKIKYLKNDFYRATRMHSADYAVARCLSVCLSVRPSVRHTPVLCLNEYTYSQSFFHRRVAPPFQFFRTKQDGNIPTGTPLTRASNTKMV